jgi:hypothetical protein
VAATPSQKELLESILIEIQMLVVATAANTAAITVLADDIQKTKHFARWQAEYLAGQDPELVDIEAGTHTFPT